MDLYESDLVQIIDMRVQAALKEAPKAEGVSRLVNGLEGIAKVLGCSKTTAQRIKNSGALDGYISQMGKTISGYEHRIIEAGERYFQQIKKHKKVKQPRRIIFK